jgi:hypothetical protein
MLLKSPPANPACAPSVPPGRAGKKKSPFAACEKCENGFLLYSLGPNGQDEGGKTRDDEPVADDITLRYPLR